MINLIIGNGEIGKSLKSILDKYYDVYIKDTEGLRVNDDVDVLNICYPYSKDFVKITKDYIKEYKPQLVIIHSTVKPGTTRAIGSDCVHSPVHGKHPDLTGGILTFEKYLGGTDKKLVTMAENFLKGAGIKVRVVSSPEASELSKILCTTYYGWNIVFSKEVKRICDERNLDYDEVYGWNKYYNEGYAQLGMKQFTRPVLDYIDGKIGGHCVVQNCNLLEDFLTDTVRGRNKKY